MLNLLKIVGKSLIAELNEIVIFLIAILEFRNTYFDFTMFICIVYYKY